MKCFDSDLGSLQGIRRELTEADVAALVKRLFCGLGAQAKGWSTLRVRREWRVLVCAIGTKFFRRSPERLRFTRSPRLTDFPRQRITDPRNRRLPGARSRHACDR